MDAALFAQMRSDKKVTDLKKLGHQYPQANISEFISLLKKGFYKPVPLKDFHGNDLVYLEGTTQVHLSAAKILLTPQNSSQLYGRKAMEEEIISTFTIENIDFSRDSVRKIMAGYAPGDASENRIYGSIYISVRNWLVLEERAVESVCLVCIGDNGRRGSPELPGGDL